MKPRPRRLRSRPQARLPARCRKIPATFPSRQMRSPPRPRLASPIRPTTRSRKAPVGSFTTCPTLRPLPPRPRLQPIRESSPLRRTLPPRPTRLQAPTLLRHNRRPRHKRRPHHNRRPRRQPPGPRPFSPSSPKASIAASGSITHPSPRISRPSRLSATLRLRPRPPQQALRRRQARPRGATANAAELLRNRRRRHRSGTRGAQSAAAAWPMGSHSAPAQSAQPARTGRGAAPRHREQL